MQDENPVEQAFDRAEDAQNWLSKRWRKDVNRRTFWIVSLAIIAALSLYAFAIQAPDTFPAGTIITIQAAQPGENAHLSVARQLKEDGIIKSEWFFVAATLLTGRSSLTAGDYLFNEPENAFSIARAVVFGRTGMEPIPIRIPEGATTAQMARLFAVQFDRFDAADFLQKAQPLEGYLFPDTYDFLPNATAETVISAMNSNFDDKEKQFDPQVQASGHTLEEIVTMASIVEKESSNSQDRRGIAMVLWSRIAKGMPLQSDVTVLYDAQERGLYSGALSEKTIATLQKTDTPYNTYLHKGLPPGPIGSPSLDSLEAAADPDAKYAGYLYYFGSNGKTYFAKNYAGHLRNIARYQ